MKDSIQSMDPPYRKDTFENGTLPPSHFFAGGILPSTHQLVADREFLAINFDNTEPAERYANGERLAGVDAAVAKLHAMLATNPPILVITGRVGGGMGYVPAHLFARLLEDALEEDQKDATFAGHKRWVFSIDLSQLPHLTDTSKGPVAGLRLLLLEKARNQVVADTLSDNAILTNAIVIFKGLPAPALDKLLPNYAAVAKDWGTTFVVMLPIEIFERGSSPDFRTGWGLELMEYKDDEKTRQHVATIAVTQFLKRRVDTQLKNHNKNDIMNATAMILMDPFAVQMITSNWRISSRYMDARFESAADLKALKPLTPAESIAIARKATANAINVYAKDWLQKIVMRSKPTHERVSAQLIKGVLVRAGSMGSFVDDDCDAMIVAAGIAPAGSDDLEAVRLLLKGSPFFRADLKGRLAWIPFTTDVGRLL